MRCIVDLECDDLLPGVKNIWCIVAKDIDTNEIYSFTPNNMKEFPVFAEGITEWIGHNFINYDSRVLNKLTSLKIPLKKITDTLVLSRMVFPVFESGGGHSMEDWGNRLGFKKMPSPSWTEFSEEMLTYCINDVHLNHRIYNKLQENLKGFSPESIRLEHQVRHALDQMQDNGFKLDEARAQQLFVEITQKCADIEKDIMKDYPPKKIILQYYYPKYTKSGAMSKVSERILNEKTWDKHVDTQGKECYAIYEMRPFNLGSPKDVRERMDEAGWQPIIFKKPSKTQLEKGLTQGHPELCEENFETLPEDAPQSAKNIARWLMLISRVRTIKQWFDALDPKDGCVHGRVIEVGANTHRMSHQSPNMANISKVKLKKITKEDGTTEEILSWGEEADYRTDMRACWTTRDPKNRVILGCDLSGIQLRAFAHYANNKEYADQILSGDIHSWNREILVKLVRDWCSNSNLSEDVVRFLTKNEKGRRDDAKTFIYAYLFGAGNKKIGNILGGPGDLQMSLGKFVREGFVTSIQGLDVFKKEIKKAAKRGYMQALDGRLIKLPSEHFAFSIYLQSFEAIVMKTAIIKTLIQVKKLGLDAKLVAVVHDETQWDVRKEHAETLGKVMVQMIEETGRKYNCNLPLTGEYKIGANWAESH